MGLAQIHEESCQRRIAVVLLPAGRERNMAWARWIANLSKADARISKAGPRFAENADMTTGLKHRQDVFVADIPGLDGGSVSGRRELPQNDVAQI